MIEMKMREIEEKNELNWQAISAPQAIGGWERPQYVNIQLDKRKWEFIFIECCLRGKYFEIYEHLYWYLYVEMSYVLHSPTLL